MTRSRSKLALGIAGLVATLVAGAGVVYGRLRSVDVPRVASWPGVVPLCAEPAVNRADLATALSELADHGFRLRLEGTPETCEPRTGLVVVRLDPSLDTGGGFGPPDDLDAGPPVTWGVTNGSREGQEMRSATVRLHPHAGATAITHELLHALGFEHPVNPPTGHVMHPHTAGLNDWRGVVGP